jgi:Domain of unknown function (DUF4432)
VPSLDGVHYSRAELLRKVGRLEQVAGVRLVTLGDAVERGVRVLEFRTGSGFEFDVLVDRAFDIGRCEQGGCSLAWTSRAGLAGPWQEIRERGELSLLDAGESRSYELELGALVGDAALDEFAARVARLVP